MTERLTLLPGPTPDDIDLDLLELGAVPDSGDRAIIEAARSGPLSQADAEIAEARDYFNRNAASLRPDRSTPWWRLTWRVAPVAALAAAALLLIGLVRPGADPAGIRSMGGLQVEIEVIRDGGFVDATGFEAADEIYVDILVPASGFLDVWTQQADGAVSELVVAQPVRQGDLLDLAGAILLDAYAGEEWLMFRVSDWPTAPRTLDQVDFADLKPGRSYALEVTRSR